MQTNADYLMMPDITVSLREASVFAAKLTFCEDVSRYVFLELGDWK